MPRIVKIKRKGGPGRGHKNPENNVNNLDNSKCDISEIVPVEIEPTTSSADDSVNICASERKLSAVNNVYKQSENCVNNKLNSGNVVIDISILSRILNSAVRCKYCDVYDSMECYENTDKRVGLATELVLSCTNCGAQQSFFNSESGKAGYDVNARLVYGLRCIGKGPSAGKTLCAVMDLPKPPTRFQSYHNILNSAIIECAQTSMAIAVREAVVCNEGSKDLTVALDGTWQKRGHTSNNGVVSATSVVTGKVIDVEVLSKYCHGCTIHKGDVDKLKEHCESGKCKANYTGVSGGMESAGAVKIFERSVEKYGVRYTKYLGDGDSKGFKTVIERKPYGNVEIKKLECVGHVQKRMGTRLRKLKKECKGQKLEDGKLISGQGRLTDKEIDNLQNYYGMAIRRNASKLMEMKQDVWATFFHKLSTDENPQHGLCPKGETSWCKFNRAVANGKTHVHKHSLPYSIGNVIKPIFRSLADPELLSKCLHGQTQNPNESFNSVVWSRIPKNVYVGHDTLTMGVLDAVLTFNEGNAGRVNVLQYLGIQPGVNTLKIFQDIDILRIKTSKMRAESKSKECRKLKRSEKRAREEENDPDEPEYGAGMH